MISICVEWVPGRQPRRSRKIASNLLGTSALICVGCNVKRQISFLQNWHSGRSTDGRWLPRAATRRKWLTVLSGTGALLWHSFWIAQPAPAALQPQPLHKLLGLP